MLKWIQKAGRLAFKGPQRWLDRVFGGPLNPMRHLGALTIFLFWIVLVSGIWLFVFFHTSVDGAYESVEYLTHQQWYFGGVMRSLHRYASDAAIVTLALHILKEFFFDRYRSARWFSWMTGVPLLWLVIPLGITGYWLVWDQLALYVALVSSELLDALPIFTDSMARNFLSVESLSDRFFTLMAFLHLIGLPIFLVFGIWIHVIRINRPNINPPRALMAGALLSMLLLSLVYPALSQGKADPAVVPESLALDWYYLLVYPLMKTWPPGGVWLLLVGFSLLLCVAPWLPPGRKPAVARVDLENCNGCERCVEDCPFGAVEMAPRSDGKKYAAEAVVKADLCLSCGICVGACPTATPFRTRTELSPGIDLPDQSSAWLKRTIAEVTRGLQGSRRLLVFGCEGRDELKGLKDNETAVVHISCMAQLPPPFVDFILSRKLADGVVLTGCANGDCQYRLGARWTEQRIKRERDPRLRKRVENEKLALLWLEPWCEYPRAAAAVASFRETLATSDDQPDARPQRKGRPRLYRPAMSTLAWAAFAIAAGMFSAWPQWGLMTTGEAIVSLSMSHAGQRLKECRTLTQDELNELAPNMRKPSDCPRARHPLRIELRRESEVLYQATLASSGLSKDGESTLYQRFELPAGKHSLFIGMSDSGRASGFDYSSELEIDLEKGQHVVVGFDHLQKAFIHN